MTTLSEAAQRLTNCLFDSIRRSDGFHPEEADSQLNDANRDVIQAMAAEHGGECWLGRVNLEQGLPEDDDDDQHEPFHTEVAIWRWSGKPVYNFGASFVLPRYDAELERLIRDRDAADYTTTDADYERVSAIHERVAEVGGVLLHWS
jgi:hypothetical protein